MNIEWLLVGLVLGSILWWIFGRPFQLNEHERRRRRLGLPPKRELPEDRGSR